MSVEEMSRDELEQRVDELESELDTVKGNIQTLFESIVPMLKDRLDDHDEQIADVETLAQNAIGIAQTEANSDDTTTTKKEIVVRLVRRRLVKDAHKDPNSASAVTTSMAQNMAQPDTDPARRTVHDAFKQLDESWDAFVYEAGTQGRDADESRLKCNGNLLEPSLIRGVAESLTNDAIREALITKADQGGGV